MWLFSSNTFEVEVNRDKGLLRGRDGAFLVSEDGGISPLFIKKTKMQSGQAQVQEIGGH